MADLLPGPVACLTGEYPRATDTFIQREVAALRALGLDVRTCSIRRTGAVHHVGPEQREEAARTFHVLAEAARPLRLIAALGAALARPRALGRALALAWRTAPPGLRGHAYQAIYLAEAMVLARHLRAVGAVHLHNHIAMASGTVAMLTGALTGLPYSFTLHGPDIFFQAHHWRLDEKIARAAFVACISDFARAQAMALSGRAHWDRLHVVHCGVDPALYGPAPVPGAAPHLLFVGRLAAVKGLPVLFRALAGLRAAHPDLRLTLIGDGPERAALEQEAQGLGGMVRFAGYRAQDEVAEMLRGADILVLPSFAEGLPVVLMEALAAGVPVIATRIAGVAELVRDGTSGLLVPPGDADALADALDRLLRDPDLRARMGAAGRGIVQDSFASATEGARLARLIVDHAAGRPTPDKRPAPLEPAP